MCFPTVYFSWAPHSRGETINGIKMLFFLLPHVYIGFIVPWMGGILCGLIGIAVPYGIALGICKNKMLLGCQAENKEASKEQYADQELTGGFKIGDRIEWTHGTLFFRSSSEQYGVKQHGVLLKMSKRGLWHVDVSNSDNPTCCDDKGIYSLVDKKELKLLNLAH